MPRRSQNEGGGATSAEGADAIGGAFHHVAQSLQEALQKQAQEAERRMQEALRLQEQEASRRLQEAVSRLEQQLQQKDTAISALQQRLDAQESTKTSQGPGGEGALARLEGRLEKVEASLQSAMEKFFPKVETLLRQLEQSPPPSTPSGSTFSSSASTSASTLASTSASASLSESISASRVGRAGAAVDGSGVPPKRGRRAAKDEEQLQRERVQLQVMQVKERARNAEDATCPLGEALCMAAKEGRLEEVQSLLDSGANVNYTDGDGETPLLRAITFNWNEALVSLLLERGADVNTVNCEGSSAMHGAACNDHSGRCVELLVDAGADVNARSMSGATPLHWAAFEDDETAVRALLAAGARRELRAWDGGWENKTPLDVAKSPAVRELLRQ